MTTPPPMAMSDSTARWPKSGPTTLQTGASGSVIGFPGEEHCGRREHGDDGDEREADHPDANEGQRREADWDDAGAHRARHLDRGGEDEPGGYGRRSDERAPHGGKVAEPLVRDAETEHDGKRHRHHPGERRRRAG